MYRCFGLIRLNGFDRFHLAVHSAPNPSFLSNHSNPTQPPTPQLIAPHYQHQRIHIQYTYIHIHKMVSWSYECRSNNVLSCLSVECRTLPTHQPLLMLILCCLAYRAAANQKRRNSNAIWRSLALLMQWQKVSHGGRPMSGVKKIESSWDDTASCYLVPYSLTNVRAITHLWCSFSFPLVLVGLYEVPEKPANAIESVATKQTQSRRTHHTRQHCQHLLTAIGMVF